MKLKTINIEKFKTIDNLSVSMSDMLIMMGENNCGKSNILRALKLFYEESVHEIDEECFYFKKCSSPISIILTYDRLEDDEKNHPILNNWIYNCEIKVKKIIQLNDKSGKFNMQFFGWQAKPAEKHFDLSRFDEYKTDLKKIVEEENLPDYFRK